MNPAEREVRAQSVGSGGDQVVRRESMDGVVWKRLNIPSWKKKGVKSRPEGRMEKLDSELRWLPAGSSKASGVSRNHGHRR